ncbi:MAG TPA: SDR family oxidoreductase [Bacteroidota bacterium]
MDLGLKGKVAMVAGASKGLGFAVARALAEESARVSMGSRNDAAIRKAAEEIRAATGGEILAMAADMGSAPVIERWVDATEKHFGGIDLVFVNTGGPPAGTFDSFDDAAWQQSFELQILSGVRLVRAVLPAMRRRGGGSIVFSTASSVEEPIPNLLLSNVFRAGVAGLAKTLANELAADRIRVNVVIPGRIDTDRVRQLDVINAEKQRIPVGEQQARMRAAIPLGRYGELSEYGRAVAFLLSDAAAYVTGANLRIDGGMIHSVL